MLHKAFFDILNLIFLLVPFLQIISFLCQIPDKLALYNDLVLTSQPLLIPDNHNVATFLLSTRIVKKQVMDEILTLNTREIKTNSQKWAKKAIVERTGRVF